MKKIYTLLFASFLGINSLFAQLTVAPSATPSDLVNAIAAGGIAVSNIIYNGVSSAASTFQCTGTCNIGITGGIILTSGSASIAAAPNSGTGQGADVGLGGDTDLDALTTGPTQDACVLEFDFIALSDTAIFNYIFASEEYSDYVGSPFNDVFGFFISGPGITGNQNIALIPGTNTPIAINNVNNGGPYPGVPTGPCNNCAYFYDNVIDTFTTAYDGLTTVLTATAANIQPGQTYHLKIAIADVQDHVFDSGVFLEAGSFRIAGPPAMFVGANRVTGNTVHICQGSSASLSAPAGFSYLWNTGATTQAINVSTAGTYYVTITGYNVNYTVVSPFITFIVDNTTIPNPVLTFANNTISSSVNSSSYDYSWTYNGMPVPGAVSPSILVSQNGCYAVTIQDPGGCFVTSDTLCVIPLGINELNADKSIRLYPNPAHDKITVSIDVNKNTNLSLQLSDLAGRIIMSQKRSATVGTNNYEISLDEFAKGIYMLTIQSSYESRKMKVVVE